MLLSQRWLFATLYLVWGAWAVGAFLVGSAQSWRHYVVGMVTATALSFVVDHLRRAAVRDLAESRAGAEAAAVRDHLTGVANRRGLAMVGAQIVEQARRQGDAVHCIFVDIDGLKRVNDALGHAAGDEVIVAVAEALRSVTRATDIVARWGGDEFCVVGPGPGHGAPRAGAAGARQRACSRPRCPGEVWSVRRQRRAARCSRRGTRGRWRRCSARPTRRCTCAGRCARRDGRTRAGPPRPSSPRPTASLGPSEAAAHPARVRYGVGMRAGLLLIEPR